MSLNELHDLAVAIEAGAISLGRGYEYSDYKEDRDQLMSVTGFEDVLPQFVKACRDSGSLNAHLRKVAYGSGAYSARDDYVRTAFTPMMERIESLKRGGEQAGGDEIISSVPRAQFHLTKARWWPDRFYESERKTSCQPTSRVV